MTPSSIMYEIPDASKIIVAFLVIIGSVLVGFAFKFMVGFWLRNVAIRTSWSGDKIVMDASKNMLVFMSVLGGAHFLTLYLPLNPTFVFYLAKVIKVLAVLSVTIISSKIAVGSIALWGKKNMGLIQTSSILQIVARIIIWCIGLLIVLQMLGVSIAPALTFLGVGGLAISLALKDTLSNLFAGIYIIISKNINPGDFVKLETGDEGYVMDVNWRSTTIRTLTSRLVIIPNDKLASSVINNYSLPDEEVILPLEVRISFKSDLNLVEKISLEVAREVIRDVPGCVKTFEPLVRYHEFGSYAITLKVIVRVNEFVDHILVKHELIRRLVARYQREGIEFPSPVVLDNEV